MIAPPDTDTTLKIPLGGGRHALVDGEDFHRLKGCRYYAKSCRGRVYAARCGRSGPAGKSGQRNFVPLTRDVLGTRAGQRVRHINGDTLDCRRSNLRVEGGQVYRMGHVQRKPYAGRIRVDGERHFLGCWPSAAWAEEARRRAVEAAGELRGRGLSPAQVRKELRRAVGLEV